MLHLIKEVSDGEKHIYSCLSSKEKNVIKMLNETISRIEFIFIVVVLAKKKEIRRTFRFILSTASGKYWNHMGLGT